MANAYSTHVDKLELLAGKGIDAVKFEGSELVITMVDGTTLGIKPRGDSESYWLDIALEINCVMEFHL